MKKLLFVLGTLFLVGCNNCDQIRSRIKTVGGCDEYGDCGALLEDGTQIENAYQAVVGTYPRGLSCRIVK